MSVPSHADAALLAVLERAFAHHAGPDDVIDAAELQHALGLKSEYLTQRMLAAFDANGDGVLSKEEFLAGVKALIFGSERDKLAFAFRLHDDDGDGSLDRKELERMIAIALAESDVSERLTQSPAVLADALLKDVDTNGDGRVSFDELETAMRARPQLLERMIRSEAIWIAPNDELLVMVEDRARAKGASATPGYRDHWPQWAFVALWALGNLGVLGWTFFFGRTNETADPAMELGRAFGACLDWNGALIFIPMMRRLLSAIRRTKLGRVVPVDDAVAFHKIVGHTLFALAVAHSASFVWAYARGHAAAGSMLRIFETERGFTGAILLGVFALMWVCSLDFVRRTHRFELFYFTHLLYLAWLGIAIAHAPRFLLFAGVPVLGFVIELIFRLIRRRPPSRVLSLGPLRSGVVRLELERPPGFEFAAGDYVFLRIPEIARHEWHPFTISSAPAVASLSFHVRSLGTWTAALRRRSEESNPAPLRAFVDGPYGSPSGHVFRAKHVVLIGAGIGVTPFASVLESLVLRSHDGRPAPEKVHFFWLNRDQYSFEWFRDLLARLEAKDDKNLLDLHLCMTGAHTGVTSLGLELAREIMHSKGRSDIITGLKTKTHTGAPDWEKLLGFIAAQHAPARVDVFFCGPHGLARALEPVCHRLAMRFHEEQF